MHIRAFFLLKGFTAVFDKKTNFWFFGFSLKIDKTSTLLYFRNVFNSPKIAKQPSKEKTSDLTSTKGICCCFWPKTNLLLVKNSSKALYLLSRLTQLFRELFCNVRRVENISKVKQGTSLTAIRLARQCEFCARGLATQL